MKDYTAETTPPLPVTNITAGARFGIRFLARIIDLVYGYTLSIMVGLFFGIVLGILSATGHLAPDWQSRLTETGVSGYAFGLLSFFLYHFFADGISGTSIGKLLCGLNVVNLDGSPCSMKGALKRDLAYYMDGLFFGLIAYESMKKSPLQQRYGDVWAKTVVVRKKDFLPNPPHPTWRLVGGILIGSLSLMTVQLVMMLTQVF